MKPDPNCHLCKGEGFVCELHPYRPYDSYHEDCVKRDGSEATGVPCLCSPANPRNWTDTERKELAECEERFKLSGRKF